MSHLFFFLPFLFYCSKFFHINIHFYKSFFLMGQDLRTAKREQVVSKEAEVFCRTSVSQTKAKKTAFCLYIARFTGQGLRLM